MVGGEAYICTDPKFLDQLYKEAGRPGLAVVREKIHWVPFKYRWSTETEAVQILWLEVIQDWFLRVKREI